MIGAIEYADPGDEDEERSLHRAVARRVLDALNEHCRLCPLCIMYGALKCRFASAYEKLFRAEAFRAKIVLDEQPDRKAA